MKKLLQINPVLRANTSTGRIMQEIGDIAMQNGWQSYIAYSGGRDDIMPCTSQLLPVGNRLSVAWHGLMTRLFDRHGLASKSATRKLMRQIEALQPDVIHIHNIHGYFLNYPLLFDYLSRSGIPVVWTIHDCWLFTGHCYHYASAHCYRWQEGCHHCPQRREFPTSWWRDRSARNFADKRAAFTSLPHSQMTFVTVSEWMKGEVQQSFLRDYTFRVIHNGINISTFHPCATDGIKEKYGWQDKHIMLGVASIWSKEKGLDDFAALAAMLNYDELLVLVGIDDKTRQLLPSNIHTIARTANVQQLAELYSIADVLINATWQDNYPTVNLEAIACGTPVVTYRTGGSVEVITPHTGRIVEQGEVGGLLAATRQLRTLDRDELRRQCRAFAQAHFSKEERYKDYILLYEDLTTR